MRKIGSLIVLVLPLACCSRPGPIERKIAAKIEACHDPAPCRIVMSEITDFPWDRMYAFKYVATLQQVKDALGTPPPQFTEFTRKIVFVNHGDVVYIEEDPTNIEHLLSGEVLFDIPDNATYRAYDRERAVFVGRRETEADRVFYRLGSIGMANNVAGAVANIPQYAQDTLNHIESQGSAPPGYQGGTTFQNDGRGGGPVLPRTDAKGNAITYREWDVHPRQPGVNRGAERLVTGSDGSAYYTVDHYQTFTKVK